MEEEVELCCSLLEPPLRATGAARMENFSKTYLCFSWTQVFMVGLLPFLESRREEPVFENESIPVLGIASSGKQRLTEMGGGRTQEAFSGALKRTRGPRSRSNVHSTLLELFIFLLRLKTA